MATRKTLDRLLRVRTLQLGLAAADEAQARDRVAGEAQLAQRIRTLAEAVAPAPATDGALNLAAAAHFRDRLHQSAQAATHRLRVAEEGAERAAEATREARRDQSAIEKLLARAHADAELKAVRALEAAPPPRKRHDLC